MPKFDVTLRSDDARHILQWRGISLDEAKAVLATDWANLPEPVARKKAKAAPKPPKPKTLRDVLNVKEQAP